MWNFCWTCRRSFGCLLGGCSKLPATEALGVMLEGLLQPGEHKVLRVSPVCEEAETKIIWSSQT